MIPEAHRDDIINCGITFMRSITEAYGAEEGMKLWDTIANTLDPDIKGQIFFALLTGDAPGRIRITGIRHGTVNQKVPQIKAVRAASGWGLREAKDAVDALEISNKHIIIDCVGTQRNVFLSDLRAAGLIC